jgi:hypothetical protein
MRAQDVQLPVVGQRGAQLRGHGRRRRMARRRGRGPRRRTNDAAEDKRPCRACLLGQTELAPAPNQQRPGYQTIFRSMVLQRRIGIEPTYHPFANASRAARVPRQLPAADVQLLDSIAMSSERGCVQTRRSRQTPHRADIHARISAGETSSNFFTMETRASVALNSISGRTDQIVVSIPVPRPGLIDTCAYVVRDSLCAIAVTQLPS